MLYMLVIVHFFASLIKMGCSRNCSEQRTVIQMLIGGQKAYKEVQ